jgi:uncharacterized protein YodC (DUF2158 family)
MAFRVGDVVQLRYGGGPRMKVERTASSGGNEWVTCVWGVNNECHNYFAAEMLQSVHGKSAPTSTGAGTSLWSRLTSWLRS